MMKQKNISMYDSFNISNETVKNRLVRSATFEFGADQGRITPRIVEFYRQLAESGSGLIISGMFAVQASASSGPVMVETGYNQYINDLKQVVDVIHKNGSVLFVQLNHAGYKTAKGPGHDRIGVSEMEVTKGVTYQEATPAGIGRIVKAFAVAAQRSKEAGCDGVQIHAGHGYLLNTFLSPYYNHRTDAYGGSIENRTRILFEIYGAIRSAVGESYPVGVKIPCSDGVNPSITPEECVFVCKELEKKGIDMIEVTSGLTMDGGESSFTPFVQNEGQQGRFLAGAVQAANAVSVPVISVAGYRTPDYIEKTLSETPVTAVSLCRPLVREPELPNRWKTNRAKAACISCNRCFMSRGIIACQAEQ